jgi:hypothetical protein
MPNDNECTEGKQVNLGADHLTFEGGRVILKNISSKAILNKKQYLH